MRVNLTFSLTAAETEAIKKTVGGPNGHGAAKYWLKTTVARELAALTDAIASAKKGA
jgi:hypothetical protein